MSVHLFQQWITYIFRYTYMYKLCIRNKIKQRYRHIDSHRDRELDEVLHRHVFAVDKERLTAYHMCIHSKSKILHVHCYYPLLALV